MTIKSINYLSLTPEQRKRGADKQRESLRALLASPVITEEQRQLVQQRLSYVKQWEQCEIETEILPNEKVPEETLKKIQAKKDLAERIKNASSGGQSHSVSIDESVPVEEGVG